MTQSASILPASILFVCLGNICRSPTAEGVARVMIARAGLPITVDSAGTGAWHVGEAPDRRMQAAARAAGYDLSDLRARQFEAADFTRFDLILAMDRANLQSIERARPAGNATPVALFLTYGTSGRAEVPDPYYDGGFDRVVSLVEDATGRLLESLGGGPVAPSS